MDIEILLDVLMPHLQQVRREAKFLFEQARGARTVLEIGTYLGGTAALLAATGAQVLTIDSRTYPNGRVWERAEVRAVAGELDVEAWIEDGQAPEIAARVNARAPFDWVFIDDGHDEEVWHDWEVYGPLGKTVAFHDIVGHWDKNFKWQPARVWSRILETSPHHTEELVTENWGGIGVVYRGDWEMGGRQR